MPKEGCVNGPLSVVVFTKHQIVFFFRYFVAYDALSKAGKAKWNRALDLAWEIRAHHKAEFPEDLNAPLDLRERVHRDPARNPKSRASMRETLR